MKPSVLPRNPRHAESDGRSGWWRPGDLWPTLWPGEAPPLSVHVEGVTWVVEWVGCGRSLDGRKLRYKVHYVRENVKRCCGGRAYRGGKIALSDWRRVCDGLEVPGFPGRYA